MAGTRVQRHFPAVLWVVAAVLALLAILSLF
jgi:hypothetical protein